jgi:L-alanine-DL-glutamate epimerase-like enolase superfamily enzyme
MKITNIKAWPLSMRLSEPYTIAYETLDSVTNIFLRIETNRGIVGYGCSAPDKMITGETPDSVLQDIIEVVGPSIKGSDPLRPAMLFERLRPTMQPHPAAMAAVDMALCDILGRMVEGCS